MASTTHLGRTHRALRTILIASLLALSLANTAWADEAPTGATGPSEPAATGTVNQFGADPTVSVAKRRHCVSTRALFAPTYTGGGGVRRSYLYINGELAAQRWGEGVIRLSAKHLDRGANSYELISEFVDGRAASTFGQIRRCNK